MATAQEQPVSSPSNKWQRTCRLLKTVTTFLWGSVILVVFINVVSTLSTTPGISPSNLPIVQLVLKNPIPIISGAAIFLLLTIVSWIGSRERTATSSLSPDQQSRLIILKSLRKAYTDELDSSLQGMARIALGLHERFDLTHPARLSSWQPGQPERTLLAGTTIVDTYDQAGNGLLILGEPGAGKSTLLYDLAQALLSRAEQDESQPLPVILNLSSWATRPRPLEQWLVEELQRRYLIPRQQSQRWLQQAKLLPLLDGLDEVATSAREACIKAINIYQSEHLVPLVVCSRREEYRAMSKRLTLQSAVIIQPLTSEQVKDYLVKAGNALSAVQTVMRTNPVLQELLTTPLMLSVVTLTYKDKTVKDLPHGSPEEQTRQVFQHYVTQALEKERERPWRYTSQPTRQWLSWLAQQMQLRNLTQFYLEFLEPSWLPTKRLQAFSRWLFGLAEGLYFGLPLGLYSGLFEGELDFGLFIGLLVGLIGLFVGLKTVSKTSSGGIKLSDALTWSWRRVWPALIGALLFGLVSWPYIGLINGLINGLFIGMLVGLPFSLSSTSLNKEMRTKPNQGIHNSGWNAIRVGLFFIVAFEMFFGLVKVLSGAQASPWISILVGGLSFGLVFGLVGGLIQGGRVYLAHYSTRFVLWRSGVMPWHAVRFLNEATERVLLQSIGGGYRFIHPLFQQYFASLNIAPPATGIQQPPSPHA